MAEIFNEEPRADLFDFQVPNYPVGFRIKPESLTHLMIQFYPKSKHLLWITPLVVKNCSVSVCSSDLCRLHKDIHCFYSTRGVRASRTARRDTLLGNSIYKFQVHPSFARMKFLFFATLIALVSANPALKTYARDSAELNHLEIRQNCAYSICQGGCGTCYQNTNVCCPRDINQSCFQFSC
ncbi:hypothetical protein CGMCC3_g280 [Colletotrichum fructicola]|nr:uncharacterized protein CGMCC3_g280 [Colletotrichum fructicola]KAE9583881.1 hypothetical protein CGMCC3_g280 [Colletotrichum fructicola]KAF4427628.1 hypothetical protein CFRS1_v005901 [Colletotrichum fructicola]